MSVQLVICDLDGTLVDSAPHIAAAINRALQAENLPGLRVSQVRELIGEGARATVSKALAQSRAQMHRADVDAIGDRHTLDRLMTSYASFLLGSEQRLSSVFPHVVSTLEQLREAGVKLAMVTNKEERFAHPLLHAHELSSWFDPVLCGDTLHTRKPDPAVVLHCLKHHDVAPEHAVLVGDSEMDIAAARGAGVRCFHVSYGYRTCESSRPDARLNSFAELLNHVLTHPVGGLT